jgi:site-specific recombinase XerC
VFYNPMTGKPYDNIVRSFYTAMKKAGIDLATARELLGHKTITMTLRYSHLAPSHKVRAVDILDSKLNEGGRYCQKLQSV